MKVITIIVIIFAVSSIIKFLVDITAKQNQVTSTICMIFCVFSAVVLGLSVFVSPKDLRKRKLVKWAMLALIVSNFIYGIQYLENYMYPSGGIVALFIILQFFTAGVMAFCYQWQLELEEITLIKKKKEEIMRSVVKSQIGQKISK